MFGCLRYSILAVAFVVTGDGISQVGNVAAPHCILYRIVFEVQLTGALRTTFIDDV